MALTASVSPQGFAPLREMAPDEVILLPGDPGVTYTRGSIVYIGATGGAYGLPILQTDSIASAIGTVVKTTVCPAASQAFPLMPYVDRDTAESKTLIPVRLNIATSQQVFHATFRGHFDDTVISYATGAGTGSGSGAYAALTTGCSADDYPNGAWVYVYAGKGAGQVNIVDDYDHTGGSVELMLAFTRAFNVALDSTSKIIIVAGEGATNKGVGAIGRLDSYTDLLLDAADGADDGDWVTPLDFRHAREFLSQLTLPVFSARGIFVS